MRLGKRTLLALFFVSSVASAQMTDGEKKASARAAFLDGVELQNKGKPVEALARFEAAESLFDAPTHLLHIGQCQAVTGKLVEADETYETLVHRTLPAGSPAAFVQAQAQGKTEAAAVKARIPTLRVTVTPNAATLQNLSITMNDKQLPNELLGIARPVNPGAYRFSASAAGYGMVTPTAIDLNEKDTKEVTLTLQQGVVTSTEPPPVVPMPPPYQADSEKAKAESPSAYGLLVGVRPTFVFPTGDVTSAIKFSDFASPGPGLGLDVLGRFAKLVLVGGRLEYAALGAPDDSAFPAGTTVNVSTHTFYLGVVVGVIPNVDKVSFIADAGLGYRNLSRKLEITAPAAQELSETYSGVEVSLNAGVSIPVGPIRIVPTAGLGFGSFGNRNCDAPGLTTFTGCNDTNVDSSSHTLLNLSLALYYHADLAKKQPR